MTADKGLKILLPALALMCGPALFTSAAFADALTACLKIQGNSGKIKRAAVGDMTTKACGSKFTEIRWTIESPQQVNVSCPTDSLQAAIDNATPGTTILVEGACNENIVIGARKTSLTIDGQSTASITGVPGSQTIGIFGRSITIKNFNGASLTGNGENAVILVAENASAVIDNNTISGGSNGITVNRTSQAAIINNTVENNVNIGIIVAESSSARIGVSSGGQTVAEPNTIQNNGTLGIVVNRNAVARIVGNLIANNGSNGVGVTDSSMGDISDNIINNNGADGISVGRVSSVRLGSDTGDTIFTRPNRTTEGNDNGEFGLDCFGNSSVDGRVGTLNGVAGDRDIPGGNSGCFDSLAD